MILSEHEQKILIDAAWKARSYGLERTELLVLQRRMEDLAKPTRKSDSDSFRLVADLCSALISQIAR